MEWGEKRSRGTSQEAIVVAHWGGGFNPDKIIEKFAASLCVPGKFLCCPVSVGKQGKTCPRISPRQEDRTFVSRELDALS